MELMYGGGDKPDLGLDSVAESSFLVFYHKMPPKADDTVRLFDRGDFFSVHGQDAVLVAATVYKTQSVLKTLGRGKDAVPSCTLNMTAGKNFLREALTAKQLKIEIWGGGTSKKHSWKLEKQATPGNLQEVEDLLYSEATNLDTSPIVLAIKIRVLDGVRTVGAAFADATHRSLGVAEYAENDLFSNTESLIIQLGARECLLPADEKNTDHDLTKLKEVIDRCDCVITSVKRTDFSPKSIEQDVNRLLNEESAGDNLPEFNLKAAMGAMQALINYLSLLNDNVNFGAFTMQTHDLSEYLRLDRSALRALSVFPEPGQGGVNKNASLFGLLNKCKTAQGQRLLGQWLKQPLVKAREIRKRHQLVATFASDADLRVTLQNDILRYMPDLLRNSKRFQKGIASLEDVVNVYQGVIRLPSLIGSLEEAETLNSQSKNLIQDIFISPLQESQQLLAKLVEMVETTIDLEELERHHYVIKAEYDDRLTRIKQSIDSALDQLAAEHSRVKRDLNMPEKVKLEDTQQYGYCFRVTRNDSKVLSKKSQYIELGTSKAGVFFTTARAKELSNDHIDLQNQYSAHQSGLVKQVIAIAAGYCPPLESLNVIIAQLDVLVCYAHVSVNAPIPYIEPRIRDMGQRGALDLKEVRHPCLEVQEDLNFIPNDVEMVPDESEFLIITGPNMGGKSTYIRSIGIVALMSQAGCFIPTAAGAKVPVFDSILARVGAGDSQLKGVSTFMSEMLETSTILRLATEDSLIIIDELGRGTSTYDGFGLAWSISEHIATTLRSKCLFASHFAEIVELANQIPHVQNLHCKALVEQRKGSSSKQDREITLLYKVEKGTSDRSYGIHVAELAGFPPKVIQLAKRKAEEMEDLDDEEAPLLSMDEQATERGMAIVEEILRAFADKSKKRRSQGNGVQEEEVDVAALREVVGEYKEKALSDPWVQKALECL